MEWHRDREWDLSRCYERNAPFLTANQKITVIACSEKMGEVNHALE